MFCTHVLGQEALSPAEADAQLFNTRQAQYKLAKRLKLDGMLNDWRGLTVIKQSKVDSGVAAAHDITAVGLAPLPEYLYVCVAMRGKLDPYDGAIWLLIDCVGEDDFDFAIGVCPGKAQLVEPYVQRYGSGIRQPVPAITAKIRQGIELRIPWQALQRSITHPKLKQHVWHKQQLRSWIRVRAISYNHRQGQAALADPGLAAACPALLAQKEATSFDPPLPASKQQPVNVQVPVRGWWYVSQGPFGAFSHAKRWAWDLLKMDAAHLHYRQDGKVTTLTDHLAFGKGMFACAPGRITTVQDGHKDHAPGPAVQGRKGNLIYLTIGKGLVAVYGHCKQRSVSVKKGQQVKAGHPLALVGNSGFTTDPHLHFEISKGGKSIPARWRSIRVRLNLSDDDPWERRLSHWQPRVGYFVSPLSP